MARTKKYREHNGTSYDNRTPMSLILILEEIRSRGTRIRLMYGDVITGKMWDEGIQERGTIGRSTGSVKIPLLIKTSRSFGGGGILDHCILQVRESKGGRVLWTHDAHTRYLNDAAEQAANVRENGMLLANSPL